MLSSASTRVRALSMTRSLKSGKLRQPEVPASTTVVTPLRNECASTWTLLSLRNSFVLRAGIDVNVNVDQPGRDGQPVDIHQLPRFRRRDIRRRLERSCRRRWPRPCGH